MTPGCPSIGAHSANCSALKRIDSPIQACLQFAVSPAPREMGRRTRDGGTANVALKRPACAETVDWRTKESLAPTSDEARLQGPGNAKEMRRHKGGNTNDSNGLIVGGGGSHRRTRLCCAFSLFCGKIQGN